MDFFDIAYQIDQFYSQIEPFLIVIGMTAYFMLWIYVIIEEHTPNRKEVDDSIYHDDHTKIGA